MTIARALLAAALCVLGSGIATAQETRVRAPEFVGTWAVTMTEPEALKGSRQTIRVWEDGGTVAASIQVARFPVIRATKVVSDGDMLIVTVSHAAQPQMLENGAPIWIVLTLARDGDNMTTAEMMERSQTIKRGIGRKEN